MTPSHHVPAAPDDMPLAQLLATVAREVGPLWLGVPRAIGRARGRHAVRRRGQALEFADSRPYEVGDDLRRIDQKLSARRDAWWVRSSEDEAAMGVEVVVDTTASMMMGADSPSRHSKARQAGLLAVAMALLAQRGEERAGLTVLTPSPQRLLKQAHRRHQMRHFAEALRRTGSGRPGNLAEGMASAVNLLNPRSWVILLTDAIGPGLECGAALRRIRQQARVVTVVQLTHSHEHDIDRWPETWTTLRDLESDARIDVGPSELRQLAARHAQFMQACHAMVVKAGAGHVVINAELALRESMIAIHNAAS